MLINYTIGIELSKGKKTDKYCSRKKILFVGIALNLSALGYFKYFDFFIENINVFLIKDIELFNLALPLAISFYTFQQIAYLVDSYNLKTKEYDFLNYAVFVTFFPQLIAGPIVHHSEMMPQFSLIKNKIKNYKNISGGIFIFSIGLFKKTVIADTFAIWATNGFDVAGNLNIIEAWVTSLSYTFQLYFDFSGYTDMAIGAALMFNIKLPINFNSPYKSLSIQDFWRRWHITLSRFLKDYIYIPLGGNRTSPVRIYLNLFITFLIGGIWHGAGWTFIIWGILHGLALIFHRLWKKLNIKTSKIISWFFTFNFINISWVFFRAKNYDDAMKIIEGMFGVTNVAPPAIFSLNEITTVMASIQGDEYSLIAIIIGFYLTIRCRNSIELLSKFKPTIKYALIITILFTISFFSLGKYSEFLYFQF